MYEKPNSRGNFRQGEIKMELEKELIEDLERKLIQGKKRQNCYVIIYMDDFEKIVKQLRRG